MSFFLVDFFLHSGLRNLGCLVLGVVLPLLFRTSFSEKLFESSIIDLQRRAALFPLCNIDFIS